MFPIISALLAFVAGLFRSRASLCLENLALRHQLAVYKQTVYRSHLRSTDRVFWTWLSRLWRGWPDVLVFVQPRTVIAWQQQRFRDHWRCLSEQGTPGRPAVAKEVRTLIQDMWQANPTWGSPRIVGELRKVGIAVAKSTVEKYRVRPQSRRRRRGRLPQEPRAGPGGPGFLSRANGHPQGVVRLTDSGPSPTSRRPLQRHRASHGRVDGAAGH